MAALAFAGLLLVGCDWNRVGFEVYNDADRSLSIYYVLEGQERRIVTKLDPGYSAFISGPVLLGPDDCSKGDLIARDSSGAEVARRTEPICNHEKWVIGTPPP
jgi:hypothetical protein